MMMGDNSNERKNRLAVEVFNLGDLSNGSSDLTIGWKHSYN
jgi:hypothetical protein